MINKTAMELKNGLIAPNMMVSMNKVKNKVRVNFNGQTVHIMKVNLLIIIFTDLVPIHGLMDENIKANGRIIKWMDKGSFFGLMAGNILEII